MPFEWKRKDIPPTLLKSSFLFFFFFIFFKILHLSIKPPFCTGRERCVEDFVLLLFVAVLSIKFEQGSPKHISGFVLTGNFWYLTGQDQHMLETKSAIAQT